MKVWQLAECGLELPASKTPLTPKCLVKMLDIYTFPLRHTGQTWSVLSIKSQEREENNIADAIVAENFGHWYGDLAAAKAAALESVMDRVVEAGSLLY